MKLKIFNGSLKDPTQSNTRAIIDLLMPTMTGYGVSVDLVDLKNYKFEFTTDPVNDDLTPHIIDMVQNCDMVAIATPIWWGTKSSLAQSIVERMDYIHTRAMDNNYNPMYNKVFGSIVSGGGDGFQHIHGTLYNFATNLGMTVPPRCNLEIKTQGREEILNDEKAKKSAIEWCKNMVTWATILKKANPSKYVQG